MLVSEVKEEARYLLNDNGTPPRISNATLIQWVDEGQKDALWRRPDLASSADGSATLTPDGITGTEERQLATALLLPDRLRGALGAYMAYRALRADNSDVKNLEAARAFFGAYLEGLGAIGRLEEGQQGQKGRG